MRNIETQELLEQSRIANTELHSAVLTNTRDLWGLTAQVSALQSIASALIDIRETLDELVEQQKSSEER